METTTFTHEIRMDFQFTHDTEDLFDAKIAMIRNSLILTHATLMGNLYPTWQGEDANEFFSLYGPVYNSMIHTLDQMEAMRARFNLEIKDWEDMSAKLEPPSSFAVSNSS
jgi:hypothetical protein